MTPPHFGLWTCLKIEKANRCVLRWSQCNGIRGKLFYEIYNVDNKATSPHFIMCTMAPGCNVSVWPERVSAGMVLTFTSSHMALSSVRTRVVWSGVEGTTMDFCRVKTHADTSEQLHKQTSAQEVDVSVHMGTETLTHVDPGVVHKLCDGHSLIRVCLQEPVNQAFGYKE